MKQKKSLQLSVVERFSKRYTLFAGTWGSGTVPRRAPRGGGRDAGARVQLVARRQQEALRRLGVEGRAVGGRFEGHLQGPRLARACVRSLGTVCD